MSKLKKNKLSVVMATLGGLSVEKTLISLNNGSLIPDEIVVSIPSDRVKTLPIINYPNVMINECQAYGQVSQRIEGFKVASGEFVLQIDDDISLDYNCLSNLVSSMESLNGSFAIGPAIFSNKTRQSIFIKNTRGFARKLYYFLVNGKHGYQPGKFYLAGSGEGVTPNYPDESLIQVDWLSGGCVIYRKVDLVTENYFPFQGKAYCEDFIHSFLLTKKGVGLFININAKVSIDIESYKNQALVSFFRGLVADFKARRYFMSLSKRESPRIYFFYGFMIINYFVNVIFKLYKNDRFSR
jgi:hypothetical protein